MIHFFPLFFLRHTDNSRPFYAEAHKTITIMASFSRIKRLKNFRSLYKKWTISVSTFRMMIFSIKIQKNQFHWFESIQPLRWKEISKRILKENFCQIFRDILEIEFITMHKIHYGKLKLRAKFTWTIDVKCSKMIYCSSMANSFKNEFVSNYCNEESPTRYGYTV